MSKAEKNPTSEFASVTRLFTVASARKWTDATTGAELLRYFGDLVERAQLGSQQGMCDICRTPIDDPLDVATRQTHIVHQHCREWPRTWLRVRKNPTLRRIERCVKATSHTDAM